MPHAKSRTASHDELMTTRQLAETFPIVTVKTWRRWARMGLIRATRPGGAQFVVTASEARRVLGLTSQPESPRPSPLA